MFPSLIPGNWGTCPIITRLLVTESPVIGTRPKNPQSGFPEGFARFPGKISSVSYVTYSLKKSLLFRA